MATRNNSIDNGQCVNESLATIEQHGRHEDAKAVNPPKFSQTTNRQSDGDESILKALIKSSREIMKERYN